MAYQVLARKWRPRTFAQLVGQEHVIKALANAFANGRLHHAWLLTGTRGVGKTTIARIMAKSLNCETGVTAEPCGVCAACTQIDAGRFVDLLEIDAASNTGIDNIREVLDNAQYAPTAGRFKVYIIDEVHMLSKSAFNAMLKTLEEPPGHVKFILATTDPQKVPITVLSRCLQFSLRQMTPQQVSGHLNHVLEAEQIPFDPSALALLGHAANGSMRDALSLLDQAIAYGGGDVREEGVRAMLGAVDQSYLFDVLRALVANDGVAMMAAADSIAARGLSYESALHELAHLLHQISIAQVVPAALADDLPQRADILAIAEAISAEETQLYYQIAIHGRRDLALAPDEYAGFSMTLMRMLAFAPVGGAQLAAMPASGGSAASRPAPAAIAAPAPAPVPIAVETPVAAPTPAPAPAIEPEDPNDLPPWESLSTEPPAHVTIARSTPSEPVANNHVEVTVNVTGAEIPAVTVQIEPAAAMAPRLEDFSGDWRALLDSMKIGAALMLAHQAELTSWNNGVFVLRVNNANKSIATRDFQDKLREALSRHFGQDIEVSAQLIEEEIHHTPAAIMQRERAVRQAQAEDAIQNDPFVQSLVQDFGAIVVPGTIQPV